MMLMHIINIVVIMYPRIENKENKTILLTKSIGKNIKDEIKNALLSIFLKSNTFPII